MTRKQFMLRILIGTLALSGLVVAGRNLPASFKPIETTVSVEIDGVDFGRFDQIYGVEKLSIKAKDSGFSRVVLRRDFVTDPSLYLWAKETSSYRQGLKDIHLVTRTADGREISRDILRLCQPLSWTVEVANPSLGGFHETVELAVQDLARY